jgi:thiol-disulfide isomerase/thioredoxin
MKYFILMAISIVNMAQSQIPNKFNLNVYVKDVKKGRVILFQANDFFYKTKLEADTLYFNNEQFSFSGLTTKPELYYMQIQTDSVTFATQSFYLDTGIYTIHILKNEISLDVLGGGCKIIVENSLINNTYLKKYLPIYNDLNSLTLTRNELFNKCDLLPFNYRKECEQFCEKFQHQLRLTRDSLFFNYALSNLNSPIIENELLLFIRKFGYKEIYENIFQKASKSVYVNDDNKAYLKDYIKRKKISISARKFPLWKFISANTNRETFKQKKIILVEFWFSSCKPCLANFIELQKIHKLYNKKGFEIVAISVDKKDNLEQYRSLIKNYNSWINILDIDGKSSQPLDITFYPYNFLLDSSGNILMDNISTTKLNYLLTEKLSSAK